MYSVQIKKPAAKFLKGIRDKELLSRISDKVDALCLNPFPQETQRVGEYGAFKVFRVRVGDYRILYYVNVTSFTVYIEKIDKRSRVYQ